MLTLEDQVLARNDLGAARNRGWFEGRGIVALNLDELARGGEDDAARAHHRRPRRRPRMGQIGVVEGDQATALDAERVRATGAAVVQVNTGSGCHLDAEMLARALAVLDPAAGSLVLIENVGNLVCPALFDLGEAARVVIMSVTEGDDKPLKYPHMFRRADLLVLNKVDLLPHVEFDVDRCVGDARRLNPTLEVVSVSASRGDGLNDWYDWLGGRVERRATAAWPMLMPPSFGGTARWTSTSRPAPSERVSHDLGEADVLEHAAGERDGVEPRPPEPRRRRASAAARPSASWNAAATTVGRRPARRAVDDRGDERARDRARAPPSCGRATTAVEHRRASARATRRASASSSMAAWAS